MLKYKYGDEKFDFKMGDEPIVVNPCLSKKQFRQMYMGWYSRPLAFFKGYLAAFKRYCLYLKLV